MAVLDISGVIQMTLTLHPDNSLTISGPLEDKELCLALLNNALDTVRNWRRPAVMVPNGAQIAIPGKDVAVR